MGRIRDVKPAMFEDERVGSLPLLARWACVWVLTEADDAGRLRWTPAHVRAGAWKHDDVTLADARELMTRIEGIRYVIPYEHDGESYAVVRNWFKHQVLEASKVRAASPWCPCPPWDVIDRCPDYEREARKLLERITAAKGGGKDKADEIAERILPKKPRGSRRIGASDERRSHVPPTFPPRSPHVGPWDGEGDGNGDGNGDDDTRAPDRPPAPAREAPAPPDAAPADPPVSSSSGEGSSGTGTGPGTAEKRAQEAGQVAAMFRVFGEICVPAGLAGLAWTDLSERDVALLRATSRDVAVDWPENPAGEWQRLCEQAAETPLCRGEVGEAGPWTVLRLARYWRELRRGDYAPRVSKPGKNGRKPSPAYDPSPPARAAPAGEGSHTGLALAALESARVEAEFAIGQPAHPDAAGAVRLAEIASRKARAAAKAAQTAGEATAGEAEEAARKAHTLVDEAARLVAAAGGGGSRTPLVAA